MITQFSTHEFVVNERALESSMVESELSCVQVNAREIAHNKSFYSCCTRTRLLLLGWTDTRRTFSVHRMHFTSFSVKTKTVIQ